MKIGETRVPRSIGPIRRGAALKIKVAPMDVAAPSYKPISIC
jgi:hypothetical protein